MWSELVRDCIINLKKNEKKHTLYSNKKLNPHQNLCHTVYIIQIIKPHQFKII